MSRVGRKPIQIPGNVDLAIDQGSVRISGPKGEIIYTIPQELVLEVNDKILKVSKKENGQFAQKLYGTFARMITNAIVGVTTGWTKTLVLIGTGYRARVEERSLVVALGYSHPVKFDPPEGISFTVQENKVTVLGIDRHLVGQIAANIRAARPPEPYKGKGVRYEEEYVRRKAGKSAKTGVK